MKRSRSRLQERPVDSAGRETGPAPSHEAVAKHAYELYLARGAVDGGDLDDWLQAERDLQGGMSEQISGGS